MQATSKVDPLKLVFVHGNWNLGINISLGLGFEILFTQDPSAAKIAKQEKQGTS
jgi:hypothetical protein